VKLQIDEATGRRYVSINQFRTYGATDHTVVTGYEDPPGCPRQYKAKYVDKSIPPARVNAPMAMGSVFHAALEHMETRDCGPEEALEAVWDPALSHEQWAQIVDVLNGYLDRGGPMTRYGTLATEVELWAVLMTDDDGQIWFRGRLDWLGVEIDNPNIIHLVDYKSQASPPSDADVRGNVQLMGYAWLVRECRAELGLADDLEIIVHLDALRWRDVPMSWLPTELDQWGDWARGVTIAILNDTEAKPRLNWACPRCPVAADCPLILGLPELGELIAEREAGATFADMWEWRAEAKRVANILDGRIKVVDGKLAEATWAEGSLEFAGQRWTVEDAWGNRVDLVRLHELLGTQFYNLASVTLEAVKDFAKTLPASARAEVLACISREVTPSSASPRRSRARPSATRARRARPGALSP
jgi:hypothetical protein